MNDNFHIEIEADTKYFPLNKLISTLGVKLLIAPPPPHPYKKKIDKCVMNLGYNTLGKKLQALRI